MLTSLNLCRGGTKVKKPEFIVLIAIWRFMAACALAIGIIAIAVFAIPEAVDNSDTGGLFGLSIAIIVLLTLISLSVAAGIGLIKGKSWGWTLAIVNAVLDLFNIPFGTVIGVLSLIYLLRKEVKEYFATA
jgi:hypothetical protein